MQNKAMQNETIQNKAIQNVEGNHRDCISNTEGNHRDDISNTVEKLLACVQEEAQKTQKKAFTKDELREILSLVGTKLGLETQNPMFGMKDLPPHFIPLETEGGNMQKPPFDLDELQPKQAPMGENVSSFDSALQLEGIPQVSLHMTIS